MMVERHYSEEKITMLCMTSGGSRKNLIHSGPQPKLIYSSCCGCVADVGDICLVELDMKVAIAD